LNGILGFTDLLQRGNFTLEERNSYLAYIETSGHQLLKVVNDIIDMASLETGQMVFSEDNFNMHDLFSELLLEHKNKMSGMKSKTIKLIYTPDKDLDKLNVCADKKRLYQIISNLITNAIGFTEKGHVIFGYKLLDEKTIEIRVEDTGIGIERSQFEVIFDRFRQVDESASRQQGGSGLGLSICKELVDLMGGRIYLESSLGKGSTFIVELPYHPAREI
jgi:signal transduction histidine kinase